MKSKFKGVREKESKWKRIRKKWRETNKVRKRMRWMAALCDPSNSATLSKAIKQKISTFHRKFNLHLASYFPAELYEFGHSGTLAKKILYWRLTIFSLVFSGNSCIDQSKYRNLKSNVNWNAGLYAFCMCVCVWVTTAATTWVVRACG